MPNTPNTELPDVFQNASQNNSGAPEEMTALVDMDAADEPLPPPKASEGILAKLKYYGKPSKEQKEQAYSFFQRVQNTASSAWNNINDRIDFSYVCSPCTSLWRRCKKDNLSLSDAESFDAVNGPENILLENMENRNIGKAKGYGNN